jgi:hypothetical protein
MNYTALAAAALLSFAGHQAHAQDSEALDAFEKIAATCKAAFDAQQLEDVIFVPVTKKWVHRLFSRAEVTYDVQRTMSVASPYQATIKIAQSFNSARNDQEAVAKAMPVALDGGALKTIDVLDFVFQVGRWKFTGGEVSDADAGIKARRTPAAYGRLQGPITICVSAPG